MQRPIHDMDFHATTAFGTTSVGDLETTISTAPECVVHPPFRVRRWLRDMIASNSESYEIVNTLFQRLLDGQSDLHEAQRILSDIGRHPAGAAVLKNLVTQDKINRLCRRRE